MYFDFLLSNQLERMKVTNKAALKIQCAARRRQARRRVAVVRKKVNAARKELEWLKQYQKDPKKNATTAKSAVEKETVELKVEVTNASPERPKSATANGGGVDSDLMDEKLRRLEELERTMAQREEKMMAAARQAEERAAAMEATLKQMEERARQEEADRLMRQQLLDMAAGPISNRSDYSHAMHTRQHHSHHSQPPSARNAFTTGRHSARNHVGYMTPRVHEAPPTARSARDGSAVPIDAVRMHHNGEDWVQLWDPEESAHYWYCERTQQAQWEAPGSVSTGSDLVAYQSHSDDSGYESGGAMTDYTSDHYESGGEDHFFSEHHSEWHEYWDELAKAKYWYNNLTGEASWTKPEALADLNSLAVMPHNSSHSSHNTSRSSGGHYNAQDWVSYIDEDTGQEYWYNAKTGETSWS